MHQDGDPIQITKQEYNRVNFAYELGNMEPLGQLFGYPADYLAALQDRYPEQNLAEALAGIYFNFSSDVAGVLNHPQVGREVAQQTAGLVPILADGRFGVLADWAQQKNKAARANLLDFGGLTWSADLSSLAAKLGVVNPAAHEPLAHKVNWLELNNEYYPGLNVHYKPVITHIDHSMIKGLMLSTWRQAVPVFDQAFTAPRDPSRLIFTNNTQMFQLKERSTLELMLASVSMQGRQVSWLADQITDPAEVHKQSGNTYMLISKGGLLMELRVFESAESQADILSATLLPTADQTERIVRMAMQSGSYNF